MMDAGPRRPPADGNSTSETRPYVASSDSGRRPGTPDTTCANLAHLSGTQAKGVASFTKRLVEQWKTPSAN
jgi:hypothetical protein